VIVVCGAVCLLLFFYRLWVCFVGGGSGGYFIFWWVWVCVERLLIVLDVCGLGCFVVLKCLMVSPWVFVFYTLGLIAVRIY